MTNFIISILVMAFVLQVVLTLAGICTWFERKISALLQDRIGVNRSGAKFKTNSIFLKCLYGFLKIFGVLGFVNTFFCDPIKAFFKEDYIPAGGSKFFHTLAPILAVSPVFIAFAVVPWAPKFTLPFLDQEILLQVAQVDIGLLFIVAMGGLSAIGLMFAGYASNNVYSILGGLRSAAQFISYELSMGVVFLTVAFVYGSADIYKIIVTQGENPLNWGICKMPLAFLILFIVGMAETKRTPFDLPEAESELISGYSTEYSGMKFFTFWIGEFAEISLVALLCVEFFLGGWNLPFFHLELVTTYWQATLAFLILFFKIMLLCALQIIIRWTVPRFRYDQLMAFGWKVLLPLSVLGFLITAFFNISY